MEGLYDATTLCVPMGYDLANGTSRSGVEQTAGGCGVVWGRNGRVGAVHGYTERTAEERHHGTVTSPHAGKGLRHVRAVWALAHMRASPPTTKNPVTRNRTRDHLITAKLYSQMLYQLSYDRLEALGRHQHTQRNKTANDARRQRGV